MQTRALKVALHPAQGFTPSDATDRLLLKSVAPPTCSAVGTQLLGASWGTQHAPKGTVGVRTDGRLNLGPCSAVLPEAPRRVGPPQTSAVGTAGERVV